ncbi:hypothetical protein BGZ46_002264 [Entomortierella lignicola]|nr:hypothetical protein BGZ46_002264 [Entomortierella lignicola]
MATAFRSLFSATSRFSASASPRLSASIGRPTNQSSKLATIANAFKKVQPLDAATTTSPKTEQQQEKSNNTSNATSSTKPHDSSNPSLDKIMKLELVKDLPAQEIEKIWIQKHLDMEDSISAVVPAETYKKMLARSREYPMVIFTSLLEYQTHGENARPFLTLTHYPELIDSKGIVLMNGSVSTNPRVLSLDQAQILTFGLQQYYVSDHKEKLNLLHNFHKNPSQFSHEKLIALTEISG